MHFPRIERSLSTLYPGGYFGNPELDPSGLMDASLAGEAIDGGAGKFFQVKELKKLFDPRVSEDLVQEKGQKLL